MKQFWMIILMLNAFFVFGQLPTDTLNLPEFEIISSKNTAAAGTLSYKIDTLVLQSEATVSLSDLLDIHSSVFVKNEGRGALSTVSFRGTAASHTDVLWNGISISSPMLGQVDFSLLPVFLSDDISISPGNSSITETSGALGGSIQLDNQTDWSKHFGLNVLTGFGSYSTTNNFLHIQGGNRRLHLDTRIFFNYSKNDFLFKNKNIADIDSLTGRYIYPVQKNKQADYRLYGIQQQVEFRLGKNSLFKAIYWFQKSDRSLPRLNTYEGDDYSNISRQAETDHRSVLRYSHFGKNGKLNFQTAFVSQKLIYTLRNKIAGQGYQYAIFSNSQLFSLFNQITYRFQLSENTAFKAEYDFDFHHVNTFDSIGKIGYNRLQNEHRLLFSWRQKFGNRISTALLLRKNWINNRNLPLVPFFGISLKALQNGRLNIRANIARNVHYPALNDLYWYPGGNPNLKTEEGLATEAGVDAQFKIATITFRSQLSLFYNNITGWIIWLPAPQGYWQAQNIKKVVAKGLEMSLNIAFPIGKIKVKVLVNYSYTRSLNYGDPIVWGSNAIGKQLPYIPLYSGNMTIDLRYKGISINYINNSYSERFTTSTNELQRRDWLYPYFMNNLYLSKLFVFGSTSLSLQLKIYNLLNEEYRSVLGRPMPRRNYLLTLLLKI